MKTITTTVLLGALLATAATPRAQEARDPKSMIPANAMVVGWSSGPGALADAFGETRLAELLGGPELGGMIGLAMMQLRAAIAEKAADIDPDELSDALTGYKGKVYFAMGADLDKVDMMAGPDALADASPWMAMIAASDGQSDLAAFQKRLSGVIEDSAPDDRFRDLEVEGRNYRVGGDDEMSATLPFMTGGHLVMVAGADLEESVVRCLGPDGRSLASTQATLPGGEVGVWMNLSPLWTMLSQAAADADPIAADMLAAIGIESMKSVSIVSRAQGEHTVCDIDIGFGGGNRGVLAAMTDIPAGQPKLLDLVPLQRQSWSVGKINLGRLYDTVMEIADGLSDMTGWGRLDIEDEFTQMFRVRLKEDLIDNLGAEMLSVGAGGGGDGQAGSDLEAAAANLEGACYGFELKDGKAFGSSFETMLRSRGLHAARKSEDYRGFKVHRMQLLGVIALYYTVSDRLFLAGLGEKGGAEVRAVLDEERDRAEGKAAPPMPGRIDERIALAPQDWQGISVMTIGDFVKGVMMALENDSDIPAEVVGGIQTGAAMASQLLDRYKLETFVAATQVSENGVKVRVIW